MVNEHREPEAGSPEAGRGQAPEYSLTGDAMRREQITGGGVGTAPDPGDGGMRRYPTDPPTGEQARRFRGDALRWSAIGGAAGAAVAMLLSGLWSRRSR